MRVVCIKEHCWDGYYDGSDVKKGNIYTVIEVVSGYGPFTKYFTFLHSDCYVLAGFPSHVCFPVDMFVELNDSDEESELEYQKQYNESTRRTAPSER
jgi:hypothetical protein